jgi:hypothetical protein
MLSMGNTVLGIAVGTGRSAVAGVYGARNAWESP